MEPNLQPRAPHCLVTGRPFAEGDRVASYLAIGAGGEILRYDLLEEAAAGFSIDRPIACRWIQLHKAPDKAANPDRALRLTAETLFQTLADPATEPTAENARLLRFLALLLERKRILRPKGRSEDGTRERYEHAKSKQVYEVQALEMDAAFFRAVREQIGVLIGEPALPVTPGAPSPAGP